MASEKTAAHKDTCKCGSSVAYYGRRDLVELVSRAHGATMAATKPTQARLLLEPAVASFVGECTACFVRGSCDICADINPGVRDGLDLRCKVLGCPGHIRT